VFPPDEFSSHGIASWEKQQGDLFDGKYNWMAPSWIARITNIARNMASECNVIFVDCRHS